MSTFEEAITQKYLYEEDDGDKESCVIFAPRRNDRYLPATIVINNCTIEKLGNFQRIRELCAGIRELDLAQNQILNVEEVGKIDFNVYKVLVTFGDRDLFIRAS